MTELRERLCAAWSRLSIDGDVNGAYQALCNDDKQTKEVICAVRRDSQHPQQKEIVTFLQELRNKGKDKDFGQIADFASGILYVYDPELAFS